MQTDQSEVVARTFYETMYPGQRWDQLPVSGNVKAMLLVAAQKVLVLVMPEKDMFGLTAIERKPQRGDPWPPDYFEQFWAAYPHKVGKQAAISALEKVEKRVKRPSWDDIMFGLQRYIDSKPYDRAWCNPATWINHGRWEDEPVHVVSSPPRVSFAAIAALGD